MDPGPVTIKFLVFKRKITGSTAPQMDQKIALITGITGQDGAYLAEFLLAKGYEVHGIKRRTSLFNTDRIDHLYQDPHVRDRALHPALRRHDRFDEPDAHHPAGAAATRSTTSPRRATSRCRSRSPSTPPNSDALGTLRLLEAIRILGLEKKTRFYQASTSELYGLVQETPQTRDHAVLPALALRRGQALRVLDHGELPRGLRHVRLQRHPVQPRIADARRDLRHAQDHARAGAHQARAAGLPVPRQPRRASATGATRATTSRRSG